MAEPDDAVSAPGVADTGPPVRVLICDDHEVFRHGLRAVLHPIPGLRVVAEAACAFPSTAAVAREVGLSEQKLKAGFSHLYHCTLGDFAHSVRMEEAGRLLRETSEPVSQVARAVGYQSEAAFIAAFKRWGGATPFRYRRREARR